MAEGGRQRTRRYEVEFGEPMTRKRHWLRSSMTSGPAILWVTFFLLLPLLAVLFISFMSRGEYGEVQGPLTVENYRRFVGFGLLGFDALYPVIILRSVVLGGVTAALCVVAGLPLAFFIAGLSGRARQVALLLVVVPFWTNLLIRTYAWQILLAADSLLARWAAGLHLVEAGVPLYPSMLAVYLGMVSDYLPYMVLPLYASVEKIDWALADAAMDLGADRRRVFLHAVLPQIMPGLMAGFLLVLIPAVGQFVIPDLLGGSKTVMLGNVIGQQFGASRDWPFGSAVACLSMATVMLGLWIYARMAGEKGQEALL